MQTIVLFFYIGARNMNFDLHVFMTSTLLADPLPGSQALFKIISLKRWLSD